MLLTNDVMITSLTLGCVLDLTGVGGVVTCRLGCRGSGSPIEGMDEGGLIFDLAGGGDWVVRPGGCCSPAVAP